MTKAMVREIDGQLVLDDPAALGMIRAVEKHNCKATFDMNAERVAHFKGRLEVLGLDPKEWVIVLLNVDDAHGALIADVLMPGHDWQAYRDAGQIPFARGIAGRSGIQDVVRSFDEEAAEKLNSLTVASVVVVDRGVAEVYPA